MNKLTTLVTVGVLAIVATACGSNAGPTRFDPMGTTPMAHDPGTSMGGMDMGHESESFSFGEPADANMATRVIEIDANDSLTFTPAAVEIAAGEVVTFRVTNKGKLPHDFTLGDEATQIEHEAEMASMSPDAMMAMADEANAFSLPVGESKELTWRFTNGGTVLFGCHITGHYAAGMKGTIAVG